MRHEETLVASDEQGRAAQVPQDRDHNAGQNILLEALHLIGLLDRVVIGAGIYTSAQLSPPDLHPALHPFSVQRLVCLDGRASCVVMPCCRCRKALFPMSAFALICSKFIGYLIAICVSMIGV